jgi:aryl-alcohol dehydrogenase
VASEGAAAPYPAHAEVAVTSAPGEAFELTTVELDRLQPEEVLVRIVASGICHTDLIAAEGWGEPPFPVVLGHEGAGVVEAVGSGVGSVRPGDHVVTTFLSCGECTPCRAGQSSSCRRLDEFSFRCCREDGTTALRTGGGAIHAPFLGQSSFATYAVVHERSAVSIPAELPLRLAAPIGCGVLTGVGAVFNGARPRPGSSLAVFGVGAVGLSAIMGAAVCGCAPIVAVDRDPRRLKLALELGATATVDLREQSAVDALTDLTGGVDYAIEAAGVPGAVEQALDSLVPEGTCVFVGNHPAGAMIPFDLAAMSNATLRGCDLGGGPPRGLIDTIVRLVLAGRFPLERMIDFYPFEAINEAVADVKSGRAIKPVLLMEHI